MNPENPIKTYSPEETAKKLQELRQSGFFDIEGGAGDERAIVTYFNPDEMCAVLQKGMTTGDWSEAYALADSMDKSTDAEMAKVDSKRYKQNILVGRDAFFQALVMMGVANPGF